jgi:hypothetical protein
MKRAALLIFGVSVYLGAVALANQFGAESAGPLNLVFAQEESAPKKQVENLSLLFGKYYEKAESKAKPKIPGYTLPLDLKKVENFANLSRAFGLKENEPLLVKNGFVVLKWGMKWGSEDVVEAYERLRSIDVPIFITSDSLLHLYHIQFDETLREIEETKFADEMASACEAMLKTLLPERKGEPRGAMLEAAQRVAAYFGVALKCFNPSADIPDLISGAVDKEITLIEAHQGFAKSPVFNYQEDYSQYVPRGHYTRSEKLKKYFKAMMYLGRLTFLLKGGEPHGPEAPYLVSAQEAKTQTTAAIIITRLAKTVKVGNETVRDIWRRVYTVTSYYVGLADDLTMDEYEACAVKVLGENMDIIKLADEKTFFNLKLELARLSPPAIYSGTGAAVTFDPRALAGIPSPEELDKVLEKTMGLRFMGQRFIPDSYWFTRLVFPTVGASTGAPSDAITNAGGMRVFPCGLDAAALIGSPRAKENLATTGNDKYQGYKETFEKLEKELAKLQDIDWNRNLYWSLFFAWKPLLEEFGTGYQTFMTTKAWQDKELNAVLSSWTALRHDTILYAKQSYTMKVGGIPREEKLPPGYVEPVPLFYARLAALTKMTLKGLADMKVLSEQGKKRLEELEKILVNLQKIAEKELENQNLTEDDRKFISRFAKSLKNCVAGANTEAQKTTLVADVHTDQNTSQVLEEGTGELELLFAACKLPDGKIFLAAGPVMSYYEFRHPMSDRLTDEKWREILNSEKAPSRPTWTESYRRDK